ncbi:MAG: Gx transporter family protein [Mariprofundaceae bacterium]
MPLLSSSLHRIKSIPRPPLALLEHKAKWLSLLLLAIGLHVFEAALPSLGPWFKPGLANIITLLTLVILGPSAAAMLAVWRVIVASFLIGTLFTPTFIISLAGAVAAATVMLTVWRLIPGITLIGISLAGALAHMTVQFVTVESLFIHQHALYYLLPPLLLLSVVTGWINGGLAAYIVSRVKESD